MDTHEKLIRLEGLMRGSRRRLLCHLERHRNEPILTTSLKALSHQLDTSGEPAQMVERTLALIGQVRLGVDHGIPAPEMPCLLSELDEALTPIYFQRSLQLSGREVLASHSLPGLAAVRRAIQGWSEVVAVLRYLIGDYNRSLDRNARFLEAAALLVPHMRSGIATTLSCDRHAIWRLFEPEHRVDALLICVQPDRVGTWFSYREKAAVLPHVFAFSPKVIEVSRQAVTDWRPARATA